MLQLTKIELFGVKLLIKINNFIKMNLTFNINVTTLIIVMILYITTMSYINNRTSDLQYQVSKLTLSAKLDQRSSELLEERLIRMQGRTDILSKAISQSFLPPINE